MDDLDLGKLETLVALMRRLGIESVGSVKLFPAAPAPASDPSTPAELAEVLPEELPQDDALFWSVAGPLPSEVSDASRPPEE